MRTKKILLLCVFFICNSISAQTFHAVLFGATEDSNIGWSCKRDVKYMKVILAEMAHSVGMNLATYYYDGQDLTANRLKSVLQNLTCSPQDIVFFYYTGHGGRAQNDSNTKFPQLLCKPSSDEWSDEDMIPVDYVNKMIVQKNPRLHIIFTDCCNNENEFISPKTGMYTSKGATVIRQTTKILYQTLLKNKQGQVIVSSSKPGQISHCMDYEPGMGMATFSFIAEIELAEESQPNIDWNTLLTKVGKRADTMAREQQKRYNEKVVGQEMVSEIQVSLAQSGTQTSPVVPQTVGDKLNADLLSVIDAKAADDVRLKRAAVVLKKHFSSANTNIHIVGRDGTTVMDREKASAFLDRIALAPLLVNFVIINKEEKNGKVTSLTVHEIYSEN